MWLLLLLLLVRLAETESPGFAWSEFLRAATDAADEAGGVVAAAAVLAVVVVEVEVWLLLLLLLCDDDDAAAAAVAAASNWSACFCRRWCDDDLSLSGSVVGGSCSLSAVF